MTRHVRRIVHRICSSARSLRSRPAEIDAIAAVAVLATTAAVVVVAQPHDGSAALASGGSIPATSSTTAGHDEVDGVDELGLTPEQATGRDEPATGVGVDEADDAEVATSEPAPAIELDPVAPPAPPAAAGDVDVLGGTQFGGGAPGSLVGNAQGCAARCITRATLQRSDGSTDVRVEVVTDVRARTMVALSTTPPVVVDGVPTLPGATVVQVHLPRTTFARTVTGLLPGTTYHVLVRATDRDGGSQYATTSFRTTTPAAAGPGAPAGCEPSCWTGASIHDVDHDSARFHLTTSVPARLTVAVSPQEPGTIGGLPFLPDDVPVDVPTGLRDMWDIAVEGLSPETTYHVVARATDSAGGYTLRLGRFTTAAEHVTFAPTFRSIIVIRDGDPGRRGSGEISFAWGRPDGGIGGLNQADREEGDTVRVVDQTSQPFTIAPGGFAPFLHVSATEYDRPQNNCITRDSIWTTLFTEPHYDGTCERRTNVATTGLLTVDTIRALRSCRTYGVIGDGEDDRCLMIQTEHLNDDYPDVWALISFREV